MDLYVLKTVAVEIFRLTLYSIAKLVRSHDY